MLGRASPGPHGGSLVEFVWVVLIAAFAAAAWYVLRT
jgi:hypothetical protein